MYLNCGWVFFFNMKEKKFLMKVSESWWNSAVLDGALFSNFILLNLWTNFKLSFFRLKKTNFWRNFQFQKCLHSLLCIRSMRKLTSTNDIEWSLKLPQFEVVKCFLNLLIFQLLQGCESRAILVKTISWIFLATKKILELC